MKSSDRPIENTEVNKIADKSKNLREKEFVFDNFGCVCDDMSECMACKDLERNQILLDEFYEDITQSQAEKINDYWDDLQGATIGPKNVNREFSDGLN